MIRSMQIFFRGCEKERYIFPVVQSISASFSPVLVYKPACEFCNELLNFATNIRTTVKCSSIFSLPVDNDFLYRSINVIRSALSGTDSKIDGHALGQHPY